MLYVGDQHDHAPVVIGVAAGACLSWFAIRQLTRWIQTAPLTADPWGPEIEAAINRPDAAPICQKCFTPHAETAWFCEKCGCAVGTCNNWMPYVRVFSEGEVLRNGLNEKLRVNALTIVGYLVMSLYCYYVVFAPVYWFFLFRNLTRIKKEELQRTGFEDADG